MLTIEELSSRTKSDVLLFHYTKAAPAMEHILCEGEILFSSLIKMNDPLEFQNFQHNAVGSHRMTESEAIELLSKGDKINDILNQTVRICCFSADSESPPDDGYDRLLHKGYCRSRMWAQYGEAHRGVCLVFRKDKFVSNLRENVHALELPIGQTVELHCHPVTYDDSLPGLQDSVNLDFDAMPVIVKVVVAPTLQ
jgi:hypothetical protein